MPPGRPTKNRAARSVIHGAVLLGARSVRDLEKALTDNGFKRSTYSKDALEKILRTARRELNLHIMEQATGHPSTPSYLGAAVSPNPMIPSSPLGAGLQSPAVLPSPPLGTPQPLRPSDKRSLHKLRSVLKKPLVSTSPRSKILLEKLTATPTSVAKLGRAILVGDLKLEATKKRLQRKQKAGAQSLADMSKWSKAELEDRQKSLLLAADNFISESDVGSSMIVDTRLWVAQVLSHPCDCCHVSDVQDIVRGSMRTVGLHVEFQTVCFKCRSKSTHSNGEKGATNAANYNVLVGSAAVGAGVEIPKAVAMLNIMGITRHLSVNKWADYEVLIAKQLEPEMERSCDQALEDVLCSITPDQYGRKALRATLDGAWSHGRNAGECHVHIISDVIPAGYSTRPVVGCYVVTKEIVCKSKKT
ncbi:hypothetical protein HDU93_007457, partial [Gonapodya sp. JEL0774]